MRDGADLRVRVQRRLMLVGMRLQIEDDLPHDPGERVGRVLLVVQVDDAAVRITRWDFAPGAVTGWHRHGWPYVVVMLVDGTLRVHSGTEVVEVPLVAGQSYLQASPHVSLVPAGFLCLTILSLNLVGDVLRARFDLRPSKL